MGCTSLPPQEGHTFRARDLLAALLAPIDKATADASADQLLAQFGSLAAALAADRPARLNALKGSGEATDFLGLVWQAMQHALTTTIIDRPILPTTKAVDDYLRIHMAFGRVEEVRVLFLNTKCRLIRDEVMWRGSVDQSAFYIREVLKRALDLDAVKIIVAHNHPSGDASPSRQDIALTRDLIAAARVMGIHVLDHLIVSSQSIESLRSMGLM